MSTPSRPRRLEDHQPQEDRISQLPNHVLSLILSYLPTKSAFQTVILSKRWTHVWTEVPLLDFTQMPSSEVTPTTLTPLQHISLKSFVDKVLRLNRVSGLQRFCVDVTCEDKDPCYLSWVSQISMRDVREIDIWFHYSCHRYLLPGRLFSRYFLVVLRLHGLFTADNSVHLDLPNLKILHLESFSFPSDEFLKRVLSNSSSLEELSITLCVGIEKQLLVESPSLTRLVIRDSQWECLLPPDGVVVETPSLRYLELEGESAEYKEIGDVSSVTEARIRLREGTSEHVVKVVGKLSGVQNLSLRTDNCHGFHEIKIPMLRELIDLKIASRGCTMAMLRCAPNLKHLVLRSLDAYDLVDHTVPDCMSSLETVKFDCWDGENGDMLAWLRYFLKNALNLKELTLGLNRVPTPSYVEELLEKLMKDASPTCQIHVMRCCQSECFFSPNFL